jgi:hypothetical protein
MGRLGVLFIGFLLSGGLLGAAAGAEYATTGTLQRNGKWEIGVTFDPSVDPQSTFSQDNYRLQGGSIIGFRRVAQDDAVVLTTMDLTPGSPGTCVITNLKGTDGSDFATLNASVVPMDFEWAAIGSQELGFPPDAVAVGTNGFDLISGGFQLFDDYDEATFVYERLTGDFDKHVRVAYQDPSSRDARAGLMVREALDEGRPRPSDPFDPAQAFSRYLEVHVTPVTTAYGEPASNTHQVNFRPYTGGIGSPDFDATENPALSNNAAPNYPNAWLRIKRTGQVFEVFRGDDGTNWVELGSFSFPTEDVNGEAVSAFPQTVFVGPSYSPENGNIPVPSGARAAFMAQFRDYGGSGTVASGNPVELHIERVTDGVRITWEGAGVLQKNDTASPTGWQDVESATGSYTVEAGGKAQFFRIRG